MLVAGRERQPAHARRLPAGLARSKATCQGKEHRYRVAQLELGQRPALRRHHLSALSDTRSQDGSGNGPSCAIVEVAWMHCGTSMARCCAWATHPAAVERSAGISSRNFCGHLDTWRTDVRFTNAIHHCMWRAREKASLHGVWRQARLGSPFSEFMEWPGLDPLALLQCVLRGSERASTPKLSRPLVLLSPRQEYAIRKSSRARLRADLRFWFGFSAQGTGNGGTPMAEIEFLRRAAHCKEAQESAVDDASRAEWAAMADQWSRLADQAAQN